MKSTRKMTKALLWAMLIPVVTFALVTHAVAQTCVQPPPGLISWWPGDGNATDIQDGNDGTLQNGATFTTGFVTSGNGQAFSFDGVDDFVSIDHNNNLNVASHSIEAWIRTPAFLPSHFLTILSKTTPAPAPFERTFGLFIDPSGVQAPRTPGAIIGGFTNGPSNFTGLTGNTVVTDGNFHHVAVTYDAPSRTIRLYVDAMLDAETTLAPGTFPDTHTLPASIGTDLSFPSLFTFNGLIDELEIYNRALTAQEIQAIFEAGSAGKCKPLSGFLCYDVKIAEGEGKSEKREVLVFNQFEGEVEGRIFILKKPRLLCVPSVAEDLGVVGDDDKDDDD